MRKLKLSAMIANPSTAIGTHHHWLSSSWSTWPAATSSYLWKASYRANRPPRLNRITETRKALMNGARP